MNPTNQPGTKDKAKKQVKPTERQFRHSEITWGALTWYVEHPEDVQNKPDNRTIDGTWEEVKP